MKVTVGLEEGKDIILEWKRKRLFDKEAVEFFLSTMKENKTAV